MNTLERIAKLEKELQKLKEEVMSAPEPPDWMPRKGEICEFGDADEYWVTTKFVEYDNDDVYPYVVEDNNRYMFCRPLNDPMVIQLVPHDQDPSAPCDPSDVVVVLFTGGDGHDVGYARDFLWNKIQAYKVLN